MGSHTSVQNGISSCPEAGENKSRAQLVPAISKQGYQEFRDLGVSPPQEPNTSDQLPDQTDSTTANVGSQTADQNDTSGSPEAGDSRPQAQPAPATS